MNERMSKRKNERANEQTRHMCTKTKVIVPHFNHAIYMFDLYDFGIWSKAMNLIEIFYVTSKLHGSLLVFTISTANNNTTAQKKLIITK